MPRPRETPWVQAREQEGRGSVAATSCEAGSAKGGAAPPPVATSLRSPSLAPAASPAAPPQPAQRCPPPATSSRSSPTVLLLRRRRLRRLRRLLVMHSRLRPSPAAPQSAAARSRFSWIRRSYPARSSGTRRVRALSRCTCATSAWRSWARTGGVWGSGRATLGTKATGRRAKTTHAPLVSTLRPVPSWAWLPGPAEHTIYQIHQPPSNSSRFLNNHPRVRVFACPCSPSASVSAAWTAWWTRRPTAGCSW